MGELIIMTFAWLFSLRSSRIINDTQMAPQWQCINLNHQQFDDGKSFRICVIYFVRYGERQIHANSISAETMKLSTEAQPHR